MGQVSGLVRHLQDGRAVVECETSGASGCASCGGGRGCGWKRADGPRHLVVDTTSALTVLRPGDRVELEVDDRKLLGAAARLYVPPLAGLLLGPLVLRAAGLDAGTAPLFAALAGVALGACVARHWTRSAPVAVRVTRHASAEAPPA